MTTAKCPKSHTKLADQFSGYEDPPGGQYHGVNAVVSVRGDSYRVHVRETAGSNQGYLEEHLRIEVVGRGETIRDAIDDARERSSASGIETPYLEQVLSLAEDEAEESLADSLGEY